MQGLQGLRKRRADRSVQSVSQARARKEQMEGKLELSSGHVGLKMINSRLSEEGSIFMKMQRLRFPSHLFPRVLQPLSKSVVLASSVEGTGRPRVPGRGDSQAVDVGTQNPGAGLPSS